MLSPPAGAAAEDTSKANENSLVLLVVYGSKKILFTGDINSSVERELIKKYGSLIDSDVLKIAHHGSKNSSSEEFLRAVSPEYAVISVGAFNQFGHPAQETLDRISAQRAAVIRTDVSGGVILSSDGSKIWKNK